MKENNRKIAMDSMQALFSKFGIANILAAIRDASILLGRHIANAMIFRPFSIVFEHRDRSRHRHRSIRRRKNDVRFLYRNVRRASKKMFGPRKPRCVDFIRQTLRKRYDFFDRFRCIRWWQVKCLQTGLGWLGWLG